MPYHVYILFSSTINQYYNGHSHVPDDRLSRHSNSGSKATKKANDWTIVCTETFDTKAAAFQWETEIKKSRKYIETLISSAG